MSVLEVALVFAVALCGSTAQSAVGFGLVLPIAPVLLVLLDPPDALLTLSLAGLAHNLLVLLGRRGTLEIRRPDAGLILLAATPALGLGAIVVRALPKTPLQIAVGVAVLVAVAARRRRPKGDAAAGRASGAAVGALSGFLTTTVGVNGPPLVLWLQARGATLVELRHTLALVFLGLNLLALPTLAAGGAHVDHAALGALLAGIGAGHVTGRTAARRAPLGALERATEVLLVVTGMAALTAALL